MKTGSRVYSYTFTAPEDCMAWGQRMAVYCQAPAWIWLSGPLGVGKTTWMRGFLAGKGYTGRVKSPTYTLIEPYEGPWGWVLHIDLYRIGAYPEAWSRIGVADYPLEQAIVVIEWPDAVQSVLPPPDWRLVWTDDPVTGSRHVQVTGQGPHWDAWCAAEAQR